MKKIIPFILVLALFGCTKSTIEKSPVIEEQPSIDMQSSTTDAELSSDYQPKIDETSYPLTPTSMNISSTVFANNENIPSKYTCDGQDLSPPLNISDVPEGAKSLVLISDDPDAPMGTWVHWTVWNINPATTEIAENSTPAGAVEGKTSFGEIGYGGPCPPSGTHRYFFKLYALDTMLDLPSSAKASDIEAAMEGHILEKTELIGLYKRG